MPIGFGKTKEFAYSTSITSGIDFVTDVNGTAGPNAETTEAGEYNDIRSFRIASFSQAGCQGFMYNGVCVYIIGDNYGSINCAENPGNKYCNGLTSAFSFQAGAREQCDKLGMRLPNGNEFKPLGFSEDERLDPIASSNYANKWFANNNGECCYKYNDGITFGCSAWCGGEAKAKVVCIR